VAGLVVDSGIADPFGWMSRRINENEWNNLDKEQVFEASKVSHGVSEWIFILCVGSSWYSATIESLERSKEAS
jgi:hypothetical protein